jgi:hypothetical protein
MSISATPGRRPALVLAAVLALLALATGCRVIAYDLAPGSERYTLELDQDNGTSIVHTTWEFTSAHVGADDTPEHTVCFGNYVPELGLGGPCTAEPLIFLRYDLDLDLDNTVRAGRAHTVAVTAYYEDPGTAPAVDELQAWATFDDGGGWQPLPVAATGDGSFEVTVAHPRLTETDGAVGLRIHATDTDGNTVEQTIDRAYGLR